MSDCITVTPKGQCTFPVTFACFWLWEEPESPPPHEGHLPGMRKWEQDPLSRVQLPSICNAKICNKSHLSCTKPPYTEHFYQGPQMDDQLRLIPRQSADEKKRSGLKRHFPGCLLNGFRKQAKTLKPLFTKDKKINPADNYFQELRLTAQAMPVPFPCQSHSFTSLAPSASSAIMGGIPLWQYALSNHAFTDVSVIAHTAPEILHLKYNNCKEW